MFARWAKLLEEHGITPLALESEEHVIRTEPATWIGGPQGVLTLTNRRFAFHPRQAEGIRERQDVLDVPVAEITVLRAKKAFIGNAEHLEVGTVGHSPEFSVGGVQDWIQTIERVKRGEITAPSPAVTEPFRL